MKFRIPEDMKRHLRFQFSLKGAWLYRFAMLFLYYTLYLLIGDAGALNALARFSSRKIRITLPCGVRMTCSIFDSFILVKEIFADGVYERLPEYAPKPGQIVFDVGAQVGSYSLKAATQVGPAGRVVSVEPFSGSFELLSRNAAENFSNITPVNAAASDFEGETELFLNDMPSSNSLVLKTGRAQKVRATTLDGLVRELKIEKVDVMKIDTEGAELSVLKGALQTLKRGDLKLVLEIHGEENLTAVSKLLGELNYTIDIKEPSYIYARSA